MFSKYVALFFTSLRILETSITNVFGKELNKKNPRYSKVVLNILLSFTVPFWGGERVPEMWVYLGFIYWYSDITCSFPWFFHHSNQNTKTNSCNDPHLFCHYISFSMWHITLYSLYSRTKLIAFTGLDTDPLRFCTSPFSCTHVWYMMATTHTNQEGKDLQIWSIMLGSFVLNTKTIAAEFYFLQIVLAAFY